MSWKDNFPKNNIYYETNNGILYKGDNVDLLHQFFDNSIDLTITSPPYDNLRYYGKQSEQELAYIWNFDKFKLLAQQLYIITMIGGVIVWIVNDATIKGSETGTSFKQALYFKECKFNLHDTMIWKKPNFSFHAKIRYHQTFEYMFILSKGKPKTFNPIKDRKNKYRNGTVGQNSHRLKNGNIIKDKNRVNTEYGMRHNVWRINTAGQENMGKHLAHPATFPLQLVKDHIISWSNFNDIILDPFSGSGTTLVAAEQLNRRWVGIEINEEYCKITKNRLEELK